MFLKNTPSSGVMILINHTGEVQIVQNDVPVNPVVSKNTNELKTGGASGITSICRRVPYGTCRAASG